MADPTEVALRVVDALALEGLPSAIGGALAFGRWVRPRATLDADINVFAGKESFERILDVMDRLGGAFDRDECLRRFHQGDVAFVRFEDVRVDLFVPSIPFYQVAEQTVVHTDLGGRRVPFLSAEALAVFKLLFFRSKDRRDLEALVEELGDQLDVGWVRRHVADMMGEDDERIQAWDRMVDEFSDG